jgi:prolyl-tRNA synthetase
MAQNESKASELAITPREKDYSQWYLDVVQAGELMDYAPVRGCMVIRPNGYGIWEAIREDLDRRFRATGHQNAYFPLLIPRSFLAREAEHVEGFAKECAIVTHHRLRTVVRDGVATVEPDPESRLEEEYVIRPTSETVIWHMYGKWIDSWRDLPLLLNQWANVMRWEMRTRPFLRTAEFLWQEGHTAHATAAEAQEEARRMLDVYRDFCEQTLALPVVQGTKTPSERFAGAVDTFCIEAMMQNGWALQAGTSHFLGQNFAKAFDVTFQNQAGEREHVWATSWGVSTRLIGGLVMTHSDDTGLVLPPKVAPLPVVIVPIYRKGEERETVMAHAAKVEAAVRALGLDVRVDDRENMKPGAKYFEWERRGVPVRIEVGPRDVEKDAAMTVRRDDRRKEPVAVGQLAQRLPAILAEMQRDLLERARTARDERIREVGTLDELARRLEQEPGWFRGGWDGDAATEAAVKERTNATIRCIPWEGGEPDGRKDLVTGKPARHTVLYARAY